MTGSIFCSEFLSEQENKADPDQKTLGAFYLQRRLVFGELLEGGYRRSLASRVGRTFLTLSFP